MTAPVVTRCAATHASGFRCEWSSGHPADGRDVFAFHIASSPGARVVWVDSTIEARADQGESP